MTNLATAAAATPAPTPIRDRMQALLESDFTIDALWERLVFKVVNGEMCVSIFMSAYALSEIIDKSIDHAETTVDQELAVFAGAV